MNTEGIQGYNLVRREGGWELHSQRTSNEMEKVSCAHTEMLGSGDMSPHLPPQAGERFPSGGGLGGGVRHPVITPVVASQRHWIS